MTWDAAFRAKIEQANCSLSFIVEEIPVYRFTVADSAPGGNVALTSKSHPNYDEGLDPVSIQLGPQAVDPRTFKYSGGTWRFTFRPRDATGDQNFVENVRRGTPLVLKFGYSRLDVGDYEPIAVGCVASVVRKYRAYEVECWDLLSYLVAPIRNNYTLPTDGQTGQFYAAIASTTLTANYTAGSGTLTVTSTTGFDRENAGTGLVLVTPTGNPPFYLTYTGIAATSFSTATGGASFGTSDVNAVIGDTVEECWYCAGHPFTVLEKMLVSGGTAGTNGPRDVYPVDWGYGVDADRFDNADMAVWRTAMAPATGVWSIEYYGQTTVTQGLQAYLDYLSLMGAWACVRQGKITTRFVQDLRPVASPVTTGLIIKNSDIVGGDVDMWDPRAGFQVNTIKVIATGSTASSAVSHKATTPLVAYQEYDLTAYLWSNIDKCCEEVRDRVKYWTYQVPERIRLRLAGRIWWRLCVGDVVSLTADVVRGRLDSTWEGYNSKEVMVMAIRIGCPAPYVDVELGAMPTDAADEFEGS